MKEDIVVGDCLCGYYDMDMDIFVGVCKIIRIFIHILLCMIYDAFYSFHCFLFANHQPPYLLVSLTLLSSLYIQLILVGL